MITNEILKAIIEERQATSPKEGLIQRTITIPTDTGQIIIISGIRRCGKSTLLNQLNAGFPGSIYLNFEDPRLEGFSFNDFLRIEKIASEHNTNVMLFDEIQNIDEWEKPIRHFHDKGMKLFLTGSNASLLSKELGTKLTGRYLQKELFPFGYNEYLKFSHKEPGPESLLDFIKQGGFPEYLRSPQPDMLRTLLRDIITRDVALRRDIRNEHLLIRLAIHLMSNIGKEFSYNRLSNILEIKSVRTTIDYSDYLKESYLIDLIPMFSFSIKKQLANPKKAYGIDTALAKSNSLSYNDDIGRSLENAVFLEIRRRYNEISYYKGEKNECDFIITQNGKVIQLLQVCYNVNTDNMAREIAGIKAAMSETGCSNGIIVTFDQEDELDGIKLAPAWKWLNITSV